MVAAASRSLLSRLFGGGDFCEFYAFTFSRPRPLPRRTGKTGDRGSCRDKVAEQVLAPGLAYQWALLPFTAVCWLVSELVRPGSGKLSACVSCHRNGGEERGVFVLSRELHKQLPRTYINNSAMAKGMG